MICRTWMQTGQKMTYFTFKSKTAGVFIYLVYFNYTILAVILCFDNLMVNDIKYRILLDKF